ncbi:hypothetical protein ACGTN9_14200 [Halobacillus sp. MO56]
MKKITKILGVLALAAVFALGFGSDNTTDLAGEKPAVGGLNSIEVTE